MKHFFPQFLLVFLIGFAASGWLQAQKVQWGQPIDEVLSGSTIHYVGKNSHGYLFRDGSDVLVRRSGRQEVGFFYVDENQKISKTSDLIECDGDVIFAKVTDEFIAIVTRSKEGKERQLDILFYDPDNFKELRRTSILREFVSNKERLTVNIVQSEDGSHLLMSWLQVNRKTNDGELAFKVFDKDLRQVWETAYYPDIRVPMSVVSPHEFAINNEGVITALFGSHNEKSRKVSDNYYLHISQISQEGAKTSSFKAPYAGDPLSARAYITRDGNVFIGAYYSGKFTSLLINPKGDQLIGSSNQNAQRKRGALIKKIKELPNGNIVVLGYTSLIMVGDAYTYNNDHILVDVTNADGQALYSKTLSRANQIASNNYIHPPFVHYDYFFKDNDIYCLYSADIRDRVELKNEKDYSRVLPLGKNARRGAFFIARINEAGQVERKMIYDYKSEDSYFYPASYEIDEKTLGVFRADRRFISPGKVSFTL